MLTLSEAMMNLPSLVFALVMGLLMSLSITLATTFVRVGPKKFLLGMA